MAKSSKARPMRLPANPFISPARSLADVAQGPIAKILGKRGLAATEIVSGWKEIVGPELAEMCAPDRIAWPRGEAVSEHGGEAEGGATLHIKAAGPRAVEVQHRSGEIIERINQVFGYAAVSRIRVTQDGPVSTNR
jgi:hypothetical protein